VSDKPFTGNPDKKVTDRLQIDRERAAVLVILVAA